MAVRAHWPKVYERVNVVTLLDGREGLYVVDMDSARHHLPVDHRQVDPTNAAFRPMISNACGPGAGISLITVDQDPLD